MVNMRNVWQPSHQGCQRSEIFCLILVYARISFVSKDYCARQIFQFERRTEGGRASYIIVALVHANWFFAGDDRQEIQFSMSKVFFKGYCTRRFDCEKKSQVSVRFCNRN